MHICPWTALAAGASASLLRLPAKQRAAPLKLQTSPENLPPKPGDVTQKMAATSLKVASGAVAVADVSTGLGIGVAKGATTAGIGVARGATTAGLTIARACVQVPAKVLGATGLDAASEALLRADRAIGDTKEKTSLALKDANVRAQESMLVARAAAGCSMDRWRSSLERKQQQPDLILSAALGSDTAEVILASQDLICEFGRPLSGVPKTQLFHAAKAWATLQSAARKHAAEIATEAPGPMATYPEDSDRWLRFTVAAFGAQRAGKLLDDEGALSREKQRLRREALHQSKEKRVSVLASFDESAIEAGMYPPSSWRERRRASRRERKEAKAVEKAKRRLERQRLRAARHGSQVSLASSDGGEDNASDAPETEEEEGEVTVPDQVVADCLAQVLDSEDVLQNFYRDGEECHPDLLALSPKEDTSPSTVVAVESKKERVAKEREAVKAARAERQQALDAIQAQERQALAMAKAIRREAFMEAKAQGQDALRAALAQWDTPIGRGKQALSCAGIDAEAVDVLHFQQLTAPDPGKAHTPGQLVAVDRENNVVVVALRGSSCLRDALVDLDCKPEAVCLGGRQGFAHRGMLRAARELEESLAAHVDAGLDKLPTGAPERILVVGHSLGAGVGALLTALWQSSGRFAHAEMRCLAWACPQVLDAELALAESGWTTSVVVGDDCVPCLSLATASDFRDAMVLLATPEVQGLDRSFRSSEIMAAADAEDWASLEEKYQAIRTMVGSTPKRLYPSGVLIKHVMGQAPFLADHSVVDELYVNSDMCAGHLPRRYMASVQEVAAAGCCSTPIWSDASGLAVPPRKGPLSAL